MKRYQLRTPVAAVLLIGTNVMETVVMTALVAAIGAVRLFAR